VDELMPYKVKITAQELLEQPHLKNLRKQVIGHGMSDEPRRGLIYCWEIANHPRDGLRPCLTFIDSKGNCPLKHRHK
jgi:hypothetical protein